MVFLTLLNVSHADIGSVGRSSHWNNLGTYQGPDEKFFIYVANANSGVSYAAGAVVILDVTADDGYTVTGSTTISDRPHCMLTTACASNAKNCKCQTYGYTSALLFSGTNSAATAGGPLYLATDTAGYAQAQSTLYTDRPLGIAYDASSTSGAVEAFLDMR